MMIILTTVAEALYYVLPECQAPFLCSCPHPHLHDFHNHYHNFLSILTQAQTLESTSSTTVLHPWEYHRRRSEAFRGFVTHIKSFAHKSFFFFAVSTTTIIAWQRSCRLVTITLISWEIPVCGNPLPPTRTDLSLFTQQKMSDTCLPRFSCS